jgi:hypothetical protein
VEWCVLGLPWELLELDPVIFLSALESFLLNLPMVIAKQQQGKQHSRMGYVSENKMTNPRVCLGTLSLKFW